MMKFSNFLQEYTLLGQDKNFLESRLSNLEGNPPTDVYLTSKDRQLLDWHLANLEFANAADLDKLSLRHWNQVNLFSYKFVGLNKVRSIFICSSTLMRRNACYSSLM